MPAVSDILSTVAAELRECGGWSSPLPVEAMSPAMRFLESQGILLESEVAVAAIAASVLKPEGALRVVQALSVPENLLPPPAPNPMPVVMDWDQHLLPMLRTGTFDQAIVAATMLYARYAKATTQGNSTRMSTLLRIAGMAQSSGCNPTVAKALEDEAKRIPAAGPPPAPSPCSHVFSISIDLVGSTAAKTQALSAAGGDPAKIDEFNSEIYRHFCEIERRFYLATVDNYGTSNPINPAKFFTVKGIGDEIWIMCTADQEEVQSIGERLIDAAIDIADMAVSFFATEHDDGPNFTPDFNYGAIAPIRAPIKVFIDLLTHATALGMTRDETLMASIPLWLTKYHRRQPTDTEIAHVIRRLCLCSFDPAGWSIFTQSRTDYIGHEIDRFFRTTKAALPGTVTIGQSMARDMGLTFKPASNCLYSVQTHSGLPLKGGTAAFQIHAHHRTLASQEMKGIGYDYSTYTLFNPRMLSGLYVKMANDMANNIPALPYGDTMKVISHEAVSQLCESREE